MRWEYVALPSQRRRGNIGKGLFNVLMHAGESEPSIAGSETNVRVDDDTSFRDQKSCVDSLLD